MKFLGYDRVVCISPHPDDVEYSMMGTIIKHKDTHFKSIQLCEGGNFDTTSGTGRLVESKIVWNVVNLPNFELTFTLVKRIEELKEDEWINILEPECGGADAICLPSEYDTHFEHRFIAGMGGALIRNLPKSLIQYKTPSTSHEWIPNLFVDITNQYNTKLTCLKEFETQQHRYYFREDVLQSFHSNFQCAKKGYHCVEQFKIVEAYR